MNLPILIMALVLLTGCTTERIIYHNNTIIREVEIIKTVEVTKPCPEIQKTVCAPINRSCGNKLTLCNIRLDVLNDQLFDCILSNTSKYSENITIEFNQCERERIHCEGKLHNITQLIG